MSWRPEGLVNPYSHSPFCGQPGAPCRACGWEAGADAILAAFRVEGQHFKWQQSILTVRVPNPFKRKFEGTFCFIPDEEANNG